MTSATSNEAGPVLFLIWFRERTGCPWRKAGRVTTYTEALTVIGGSGDWHVQPVFSAAAPEAQPDLFDAAG